jgi:TonB-linked SusC/RagA family outer membrane protein
MRSKFKWIYTLLIVLSIQLVSAQEKTVTGVVSDAVGSLPGVNLIVKGTKKSAQTDLDGKYSVQAKAGDVLFFSYAGMIDKTVVVGASSTVNVILKEKLNFLDEVVVVAFGKQTAKSIVGSVVTIGKEVLGKQQATSVLTSLQGTVAGVNIIAAGGQPGENPTIRIRGVSSINASADPLIILDGAPFNGNINTISSDQIESISVLKDASSTALYGSRGSNGVIVITTKRGKLGSAPRVTFSTLAGFAGNAVKLHGLVDSDTYMKYSWEGLRNANQYVGGQSPALAGSNASNQLVSDLGYNPYVNAVPVDANGNLVSTEKKWDTNWEDLMLNNAAVRQEHSLGVSGGSDKTTYAFSANYLGQEGNVVTSNFDRVTTRLSIDSQVTDWFKAGITSFYSTSSQNFPTQSGSSFQSAIQWIYTVPSIYPVYRRGENGDLVTDGNGGKTFDYGATPGQLLNASRPTLSNENAFGSLYNYKTKNKRDNFTANAYLEFTLAKDLVFKTNFAYDKFLFDSYVYANNEVGYASSVGGRVTQNRDFTTTTNIINSLSYTKSFGNHNFNALAIQEAYKFELDQLGAQGEGFLPGVYVLSGSTTPSNVSGSITEERIASYLGRLSYNYGEKYFLEGSFRRDGSTRFNKDVRWGSFYAVGGSWLISEEKFLQNSTTISNLKLKASYGELGNNRAQNSDGTGNYFPYLQLFNTGFNELNNTGVVIGGAVDPFLTWEKTASSNFGLEFGLFRDRIFGSVDYYSKESVDLIYDKPLPGSTGNTEIITNVGALKNYGWEVSLNSRNIVSADFIWTTGLNFSMDKNEISELTQQSFTNGNKRWEVGRSLYDFFIQEWAGVDPATGYGMWYKDVLGTDGLPTGERETTQRYSDATRYEANKSSLPDVVGGLTNFFKYKNVDLNVLLNFSFGAYVYDNTYASLMAGFETPGRSAHQDLQDRWQQPGDITDVPLLLTANNDFNSQSTRFLFNNDYVRLKALNLGYNFSEDALAKTSLSSLRLYLQADNLLTWQSHKGIDPEQALSGNTNSRSYNQRIVSFGVNLEF